MKRSGISKKSPLPIYYQIKEILKEKIEGGALKPHEALPSERELGERYNISRMTARRALSELELEGYVYREQGKGSFVAEPKFRQALLKLTGFTEDMHDRGLKPGAKVLDLEVISNDPELAERFKASPEEKFVKLQRVRTADGEPLAIETSFLRRRLSPGIEKINFNDRSLYETLRKEYGIHLGRAEQTVEASLSSAYEAKVLTISEGMPVLSMERTTYLEDGVTIIEYVSSTYRADRYKFYVELRR